MLDLRNLETFVWVARLSGFRLAAEKLNTTQPAISARIAQLEEDLGARLFERNAKKVQLTSKGGELLGYAERMLSLRTDLLRAVGDPASLRGRLRLGVPETIVHTWLAALVERINTAYPAITLDIEVDSTVNLREALVADRLDIAFLFGELHDPRFRIEPLCSYPLAWFAAPRLPLPAGKVVLSDVARWPIITFRRGSAPHDSVSRLLFASELTQARIFGSSSIAGIVRMALDGIGTCVLPPSVVTSYVAEGALRQLDLAQELAPIDFHISYPAKTENFLVAVVADLAASTARQHSTDTPRQSKYSID